VAPSSGWDPSANSNTVAGRIVVSPLLGAMSGNAAR
jgi:hypothetical protein